MLNLLHDRIDRNEELLERASNIVRETMEKEFFRAMDAAGGDTTVALEAIAALVGNKLSELTSEAVMAGYEHAIARAKFTGDG